MYFSGGQSCYNLVPLSTNNKTHISHTLAPIVALEDCIISGAELKR